MFGQILRFLGLRKLDGDALESELQKKIAQHLGGANMIIRKINKNPYIPYVRVILNIGIWLLDYNRTYCETFFLSFSKFETIL